MAWSRWHYKFKQEENSHKKKSHKNQIFVCYRSHVEEGQLALLVTVQGEPELCEGAGQLTRLLCSFKFSFGNIQYPFFPYFMFTKIFFFLLSLKLCLFTRSENRSVAGSFRFPVRAHAWVVGQVPSGGCVRGNHTLMFLFLSFSLPSPLSKNK